MRRRGLDGNECRTLTSSSCTISENEGIVNLDREGVGRVRRDKGCVGATHNNYVTGAGTPPVIELDGSGEIAEIEIMGLERGLGNPG